MIGQAIQKQQLCRPGQQHRLQAGFHFDPGPGQLGLDDPHQRQPARNHRVLNRPGQRGVAVVEAGRIQRRNVQIGEPANLSRQPVCHQFTCIHGPELYTGAATERPPSKTYLQTGVLSPMPRIALLGSLILSMTFLPNALAQDKPGDPGMGPKQAHTPPPDSSDAGKKPGETGRARNPNSGPWDHDLVIVDSADGNTWSKPTTFVDRGGVPSIVHDSGGKLIAAFQWFPMDDGNKSHFDQIAVVTSSDNGKTWDKPTTIVIDGFPKDAIRPCDPTLAVLD